MKKKIMLFALAICVLAPITLSARAFDFNLGATAQYQNDVIDQPFEIDDLLVLDNYRFGAEMRLNFLFVEVIDTALFGSTTMEGDDIKSLNFNNHLAVGVYFDLFNTVRLGLDVGPEFDMNINKNGVFKDDMTKLQFGDVFMESICSYKAHADFLIGKSLTLSATYTLPTEFSLNNNAFEELIPGEDDWSNGRFGISLLLF